MTSDAEPIRHPILDVSASQQVVAEWLLPHAVDDIESRVLRVDDRYATLGIAPVVRRTLLDEHPTLWRAVKRQKLVVPPFEYTPYTPKQPSAEGRRRLMLSLAKDEFRVPTVKGRLSSFLAAPIGEFDGAPVSVKELVNAFAHVLGGVHGGLPSSDLERLLLIAVGSVPPAGTIGLEGLRSIGAVVARTLRPVADSLRSSIPSNSDEAPDLPHDAVRAGAS